MADRKDPFADFQDAGEQFTERQDAFSDFPDAERNPTFSERAGAAAEAGGRSLLQGSGVAAGALSGGAMGAPFGPAGMAAGALIGGALGYGAGEMAAEQGLGLRGAQQMPQELRTSGVFGEAVGGSIPFAAAPFAAAATGIRAAVSQVGEAGYSFAKSSVGNLVNAIVDTARRRPVTVALTEASSATGAGTGAVAAETILPGNEGARAVGEMAGATLNPVALTVAGARKTMDTVRGVMSQWSPAAQQTAAAQRLRVALDVTGEDPTALARILRDAGETDLTASQITGSPALAAMEKYLAKHDERFGAEAAAKARDGMESIRAAMANLTATGDPAALAAAAQIRGDYYRTMMTKLVEDSKADAITRAGKIAQGKTTEDRERLSEIARDALDNSMTMARSVERELWSKVDGAQPVQPSNLQQTYNEIVADTLPELRNKKMPTEVRDFLARVNKGGESGILGPDGRPISGGTGTNIDEMRKLRSELLTQARAAERDPDKAGMGRIYSDLANAVIDDMDAAFRGSGNTAYDDARTFTREFNDVFTRSFVGRATGVGKYGDRVAPEVLLKKALATGKQEGAIRLRELEEATNFLPQRGFSDDRDHQTMLNAQEQILRIAAGDAVDPATGVAKPERIQKFVKDNVELMNRFPEVKEDLLAAAKSTEGLRRIENRAKGVQDIVARQGEFAQLMGATGSNPRTMADVAVKAARRVLVSADQNSELDRLIRVAEGGGAGRGGRIDTSVQSAKEGLSSALLNAALDDSIKGGTLNLDVFKDIMTRPVVSGSKPLQALMVEKGLMTPKQSENLTKLFQQAGSITRSQVPETSVQVKDTAAGQAMTFFARLMGSKAAGMAQAATGTGSGASIVVHGAGARFAEYLMTRLPVTSTNKVLVEAMQDPKKMADLLIKVDDTRESAQAARRIYAWLVQSALIGDDDQGSNQ